MAVKVGSTPRTMKSTGKVAGPPESVERAQTVENSSTDAVEYLAPGKTVVEHYGQDVVVVHPTPGPVTMSVSWLSEAETKVIEAPEQPDPDASGVEVETK